MLGEHSYGHYCLNRFISEGALTDEGGPGFSNGMLESPGIFLFDVPSIIWGPSGTHAVNGPVAVTPPSERGK